MMTVRSCDTCRWASADKKDFASKSECRWCQSEKKRERQVERERRAEQARVARKKANLKDMTVQSNYVSKMFE